MLLEAGLISVTARGRAATEAALAFVSAEA
jgi:Holliday junction resolvasome RuvABC ATP-dependent DNA helicase subunit